jgi:hypothetical protein
MPVSFCKLAQDTTPGWYTQYASMRMSGARNAAIILLSGERTQALSSKAARSGVGGRRIFNSSYRFKTRGEPV